MFGVPFFVRKLADVDRPFGKDCFRDAAREMGESPDVAIIQHESGKSLSLFSPSISHVLNFPTF